MIENPFLLGAMGGFLNALFVFIKKIIIQPPTDRPIDYNHEIKLLLVTGFSYAIAGGMVANLLDISHSPPIWSFVIGVTSPQFIHKLV
jgi:hypothetical protein